ncbi:MAG: uroporphyrinogen decarboxylase family protein [Anaerolineae bacterium]
MTSKERMLAAIAGDKPDHVPLYSWTFGFRAPEHLRWQAAGRDVPYWYSMRLEHIHTLPQPWDVEQDFRRVDRWLGLGVDDVIDVSVPWSVDPRVTVQDWVEPPSADEPCPLLHRRYDTPAGVLDHVVRDTGEAAEPGWVVQPEHVALIEDYNIPRAVRHALVGPEDLPKLRYLLQGPTEAQTQALHERMALVRPFAADRGVLVQAWTAFGMDGLIWLMGVERAVLAALQEPEFFADAVTLMADADCKRTEAALAVGGIDMVVQRGWYSSTDFWSPALFRRFVLPHLKRLADTAHQAGARFGYVMTTGLMEMMDALAEAGIDLLYFVDPVQDRVDLRLAKERLAGRFALAGGLNSGVTLTSGSEADVRLAVQEALTTLGPSGFVLSPVDALFPDTPWANVAAMIDAWKEFR